MVLDWKKSQGRKDKNPQGFEARGADTMCPG